MALRLGLCGLGALVDDTGLVCRRRVVVVRVDVGGGLDRRLAAHHVASALERLGERVQ